jgi:GrpB-like predicted nucleotidyltransferase (UPF0157 family)
LTGRTVEVVRIERYDPAWPEAFAAIGARVREAVGSTASRIDHIGSSSVPGLDAKDVVDIQVSVADDAGLDRVSALLDGDGWKAPGGVWRDHVPPGAAPDDREWAKRFLSEPAGTRRVNLHVRVIGRANQRYPLLFRDYLRAHPDSAHAYATLKRDLASVIPDDVERYTDVKDAACDLIFLAAEEWALATGWVPGPSDA